MSSPRLPRDVWLAALVMAALRAIPFALTRLVPPAPGTHRLPIGYIAKDWLQYVALVREPPALAFANPFTTEPHAPRIVSLFLSALSAAHRVTGVDPFWLLELSRAPLLLALLALVWRLAGEVLGDGPERRWALWLVALSGGLEAIAVPLAQALRPEIREAVVFSLNHTYGWSTFGTAYNTLWLAALVPLVALLTRVLRPGPSSVRDAMAVAAGLALLYAIHPYTAVAAAVIVATATALTAWMGPRAEAVALARKAAGLVPGGLAILAVVAWQLRDPVFRSAAGGLVGPQQASPFFYPVTLGALGLFALRGAARWTRAEHAWRFAIGGWVLGIALLHSSPILNGYHFVPYLHLALSLVAASGVVAFLAEARSPGARRIRLAVALPLLFVSPAWLTWEALSDARTFWVEDSEARVLARLAELPPGNVLGALGVVGNAAPAYGRHRVYVGHWFLTPEFRRRSEFLERALSAPIAYAGELRGLVGEHRIAYVIAPTQTAQVVASVVSARAVEPLGRWALLRL